MKFLYVIGKSVVIMMLCGFTVGCASITGNNSQTVSIDTTDKGTPVTGAQCRLVNDKGTWYALTPNSVNVRKSAKDLTIVCEKDGLDPGSTTVASSVNAKMFGNVIFGGGVGAVIDHAKGTAYDYPQNIPVEMGKSQNLGKMNKKVAKQDKESSTKKG